MIWAVITAIALFVVLVVVAIDLCISASCMDDDGEY